MRRTCAAVWAFLVAVCAATLVVPASPAAAFLACDQLRPTLVGPGDGTLTGTPGQDVVFTQGASRVVTLGGDDKVCITGDSPGGVSIDTGDGDDAVQQLDGDLSDVDLGPGDDSLDAALTDDFLAFDGGPGRDSVTEFDNVFPRATMNAVTGLLTDDDGRETDKVVRHFEDFTLGADRRLTFIGGPADETLAASACLVRAAGHGGDDRLLVFPEGETHSCASYRARFWGGRGDDQLVGALGRAGRDRMVGGRGNDQIEGGPGDDHIIGGKGRDEAAGGRGRDVCRAEARIACERR